MKRDDQGQERGKDQGHEIVRGQNPETERDQGPGHESEGVQDQERGRELKERGLVREREKGHGHETEVERGGTRKETSLQEESLQGKRKGLLEGKMVSDPL